MAIGTLLAIAEVAKVIGVSVGKIKSLIKRKKIHAVRKQDGNDYIEENEIKEIVKQALKQTKKSLFGFSFSVGCFRIRFNVNWD